MSDSFRGTLMTIYANRRVTVGTVGVIMNVVFSRHELSKMEKKCVGCLEADM